jgi:hypothetical protein
MACITQYQHNTYSTSTSSSGRERFREEFPAGSGVESFRTSPGVPEGAVDDIPGDILSINLKKSKAFCLQ